MNKKVKLIESHQDLYETIYPMVKEALLQEDFWNTFKGSLSKVGKDAAQGAQGTYNGITNAGRNFAHNVKNKANSAIQSIKDYGSEVKRAGQMAGLNADNQKIADQLQNWFQSGVFGNSPFITRAISALINSLNRNFNSRFGQMGSAQRYR